MRLKDSAASGGSDSGRSISAQDRAAAPGPTGRLRLAIVGSGIAGLGAAAELSDPHDITLFEAGDHIGGHVRTVDVELGGRLWPVDTGFVVYNETTYPHFTALLGRLGVRTRPAAMGFSVSDPRTGLEYCGSSINGLFAQRRNLFRPSFYRLLRDIMRFNREAPALAEAAGPELTLGRLVESTGFSRRFRDDYLVPMAAAIWSARAEDVLDFPALFFVRFFRNHGLLEPPQRQLQWRTLVGGSREYVAALIRPFAGRIRLATPVREVQRSPGSGVVVRTDRGAERFDQVILATHADQTLALLADATESEREILGAFKYLSNTALLHTDTSLLPKRRRAWASWNSHGCGAAAAAVAVTYHMSMLQGLDSPAPFLVTLNDQGRVADSKVLARMRFDHPVFTLETLAAQQRHGEISGIDRVHFCGAYWRNGFHEDGLASGVAVARTLLPTAAP